MNDPIEQKILEWCRTESAKRKRVIGMRDTSNGAKIVRYLDAMGNSYVSRYGVPEKPLRFDPDVVLAHGATWADVARELGVDVPCVVRFDESPEWPAAAIRGTWNGWLIPAVTPEIRDAIATWIETSDSEGGDPEDTTVRDIRATEPGPDGLCVLDHGLCFSDAAE